MNFLEESQYKHVEKGIEEYIRDVLLRKKLLFFWILSKLHSPRPPSPQFGQLVQLFSDIQIQDLKDSLGLKILYVLHIILHIYKLLEFCKK